MIRISKYNMITVLFFIYFTSKLLWDGLIFGAIEYLSLIAIIYFAVSYFFNHTLNRIEWHYIFLFLTFSIYVLINAFIKDSRPQFNRALYEYITYGLLFFTMGFLLSRADFNKCCMVIKRAGLVIAILSFYEYFTISYLIHEDNIVELTGSYTVALRSKVFTRSYLSHGMVLGFFAIIYLYVYLRNRKKSDLFGCIFCYIAILTTASRGPLVAYGISIALIILCDLKSKKLSPHKLIIICLIIILVLAFVALLQSNLYLNIPIIDNSLERIRSIFDWNEDAGNVGRIKIWNNSIKWFEQDMLTGIGPSKTGSWNGRNWGADYSLGVTESMILKRLCELGIIGCLLHYALISLVMVNGIRVYKTLDANHKKEMLCYFGILVAVLIDEITLQATEEIMVAFLMWSALAGINVLTIKAYDNNVQPPQIIQTLKGAIKTI